MSRRNFFILAMLFGAFVLTTPRAKAQDSETTADVRCVAISFILANDPDPNLQASGRAVALYYLGRLDGRNEKLDLEPLLMQQAAQMTEAEYHSGARECGERMKIRGQQIVTMAQDMANHARAQPSPSK